MYKFTSVAQPLISYIQSWMSSQGLNSSGTLIIIYIMISFFFCQYYTAWLSDARLKIASIACTLINTCRWPCLMLTLASLCCLRSWSGFFYPYSVHCGFCYSNFVVENVKFSTANIEKSHKILDAACKANSDVPWQVIFYSAALVAKNETIYLKLSMFGT